MKKRLVLLTLILTLAVFSIASGTEILFWAMDNAPSALHVAWMQEKAAEFEAKTGIKVVFEEIGWGAAPES